LGVDVTVDFVTSYFLLDTIYFKLWFFCIKNF